VLNIKDVFHKWKEKTSPVHEQKSQGKLKWHRRVRLLANQWSTTVEVKPTAEVAPTGPIRVRLKKLHHSAKKEKKSTSQKAAKHEK